MINIKTTNYGKKVKEIDSNKAIELDPDMETVDFNGSDYLLFSPTNQKVIQINKSGFKELKTIDEKEKLSNEIIYSGLYINKNAKEITTTNKEQYITIIFTGCNLDCRYCYLDEKFEKFKKGFLEESIKKFSSSERENWVSFHGGETEYSRKTIKKIVDFSKKELDSVKFAIQTNGVMKDDFARWINKNIDHITLSSPGLKKFQNKYRPLKGGVKTDKKVKRFLNIIDESKLTTHTVLTQENINFLEKIVDYFYKKGIKKMEFGPLLDTKKSVENNLKRPEIDLYIDNVLKVVDKYFKKDAKFSFWGLYRGVRGKRCMVYEKNSVSLFKGNIIGKCLDINNIFDVGCYKNNKFNINQEKIKGLSNDHSKQFPPCHNCFLKYNCSGLCPLKNYEYSGSIEKPNPKRCLEVKKINKNFITYIALREIGYKPSKKYNNLRKKVKSIKINLGSTCNNDCKFCEHKSKKTKISDKKNKEVKKIIDSSKNNYNQIIFSGGEVTLHNNLPELVEYAKNKEFKLIKIETNGRRFFYEDYCQKLVGSGANYFKISLHGPDRKTHDNLTGVKESFNQTVKGIKNLIAMDQNIIINYLINKQNYKKIPETIDFLAKLGVFQVEFNLLQADKLVKNNKKQMEELIIQKKDIIPYLKKGIKKAEEYNIDVFTKISFS